MATTRNLVNNVLRGIRQFGLLIPSGTDTITDDYLLMILQFLNEAKAEVEDSGWPWHALRSTVTLTLASAQVEYELTVAGDADVATNDRTRLLYENTMDGISGEGFYQSASSVPMVFDVTDSVEVRLTERTQEQIERMHFMDNDDTGKPRYFSFYTDGDSIDMKIFPTPDATYTIKLRLFIPQADMSSTDTTTVLSIPSRPVWAKALFKANEERGSELGKQGSSLHQAYMDAHWAAVGREMTPSDMTVRLER